MRIDSFLSLKSGKVKKTVQRPEGVAAADVYCPGVQQLKLRMYHLDGNLPDRRADYGCRVYWGILPTGDAAPEQTAHKRHYLQRPPSSGEELPRSRFTRRKKDTFGFMPEDSGYTAWFCIRYENRNGESGPWGPMFSAVIP